MTSALSKEGVDVMAECFECHQDMSVARSCTEAALFLVNGWFQRITYGSQHDDIPKYFPARLPNRCGDCATLIGGYHHPGCDMERCPRCLGQLIACGCQDPDEGG